MFRQTGPMIMLQSPLDPDSMEKFGIDRMDTTTTAKVWHQECSQHVAFYRHIITDADLKLSPARLYDYVDWWDEHEVTRADALVSSAAPVYLHLNGCNIDPSIKRG
eukprot:10577928-Karenia_brevis.AAC.1